MFRKKSPEVTVPMTPEDERRIFMLAEAIRRGNLQSTIDMNKAEEKIRRRQIFDPMTKLIGYVAFWTPIGIVMFFSDMICSGIIGHHTEVIYGWSLWIFLYVLSWSFRLRWTYRLLSVLVFFIAATMETNF